MPKCRICVVTGSRAEYGLLQWIIRDLQNDPEVQLQVIVTGMHLSPDFGMTVKEIEGDGVVIADRIEMLMSSDTAVGVAKSIGLGVIGFADSFARLRPDILVLLGDRFEILAAAQAAMAANIPIAHIAGGDTTEGAIDEVIRHALTKLAHVHFVTNDQAARRVRQMGEAPERIHVVGSPGLDSLRRLSLLDRSTLEGDLEITFRARNLLITFHPVTLPHGNSEREFQSLLDALHELGEDFQLFFTRPNADAGGRTLNRMLDDWIRNRANARAFTSLGHVRYLSLMAQTDATVGNSSSGLYETPSLGKPTIDIGERQHGRLAASSVFRVRADPKEILEALRVALNGDFRGTHNPYGDGRSSQRIVHVLKSQNPTDLLKKRFAMLGE